METKLTFFEELAVSNAIALRIRDLSRLIHQCSIVDTDLSGLNDVCKSLKSAYRKLTGVDFDSVHHD